MYAFNIFPFITDPQNFSDSTFATLSPARFSATTTSDNDSCSYYSIKTFFMNQKSSK
jgi:hypothetical protein